MMNSIGPLRRRFVSARTVSRNLSTLFFLGILIRVPAGCISDLLRRGGSHLCKRGVFRQPESRSPRRLSDRGSVTRRRLAESWFDQIATKRRCARPRLTAKIPAPQEFEAFLHSALHGHITAPQLLSVTDGRTPVGRGLPPHHVDAFTGALAAVTLRMPRPRRAGRASAR